MCSTSQSGFWAQVKVTHFPILAFLGFVACARVLVHRYGYQAGHEDDIKAEAVTNGIAPDLNTESRLMIQDGAFPR